jgi:hypothetical protein
LLLTLRMNKLACLSPASVNSLVKARAYPRGEHLARITSVACTINVYDRRFYDHKLRSSLERKLQSYDHNPS